MKIDSEKLKAVLERVGSCVYGDYCEAAVTVGELDGVVYRILAMDAMSAEGKDCTDVPEWARCVSKA